MPRYWARWYEPKTDPWDKAEATLREFCGDDSAKMAIAALKHAEFEIEWPFWEMPSPPSALHVWKTGEAMSGEYMVICAVFDATDEDAVRSEIGEREGVDVDQRADDWLPGDRFPIPAPSN